MVVLGILLLVIGAIVAFAVDAALEDVDLVALGYILMGGGVLALIVAAVRSAMWANSGTTEMRHERHVSDDGRHVVDETQTR